MRQRPGFDSSWGPPLPRMDARIRVEARKDGRRVVHDHIRVTLLDSSIRSRRFAFDTRTRRSGQDSNHVHNESLMGCVLSRVEDARRIISSET